MSKRTELEAQIAELDEQIANWEPDPDDYTEQFDDMLREVTGDGDGDIHIGNLTYDVAYVLKEIDPTAYRCGLLDWLDAEQRDENIKPDELIEERDELQSELDELDT